MCQLHHLQKSATDLSADCKVVLVIVTAPHSNFCHAADQSMICSMVLRLSNFPAFSKTRRDGERLDVCHFVQK